MIDNQQTEETIVFIYIQKSTALKRWKYLEYRNSKFHWVSAIAFFHQENLEKYNFKTI